MREAVSLGPCHPSRMPRYLRARSTWGSICKTSYMVSLTTFVPGGLTGPLPGIQLGLYFKTIHVFLCRRKERRKSDVFYAVFSSVMLPITIRIASDGLYGEKMWLTDRNYPGGPLAYGEAHASDAYMVCGAAAVVILQQMTDALMVSPLG